MNQIKLIILFATTLLQVASASPMAFPGSAWETVSPESENVNSARLQDAIQHLEANTGRDGARELVIVRNGKIIWHGDNIDHVHGIWSCTKSFTSTVLGLLIDDRKCALETTAAAILPEMKAHYPHVMLRHFATMTSGYRALGDDATGGYTHGPSSTPFKPSPQPLFTPGSAYAYWDSAMNQFGHALAVIAGEPMDELFKRRIADPIQMNSKAWSWGDFGAVDGIRVNGGAGNNDKHIKISARELARFGHLFLNKGNWNGKQLISRDWIETATSVHVPPGVTNAWTKSGIAGPGHYGLNWWRNSEGPDGKLLWPGAPDDTFGASGHNNNKLFVIPRWNIVIVRLGLDQGDRKWTDPAQGEFLRLVGAAIQSTSPRPKTAAGPLRIHPENSRYFTDGTKLPDGSLKAIYLTGSHHWNNLQDSGRIGGPITNRFDYDAYLNRLVALNHNFIRLWAWEGPAYWYQGGQNDNFYEPLPWARSPSEKLSDGTPKFDLDHFNEDYFQRLRARVIAAREKGIYVSIMLFQGWSIYSHGYGNPWPGHPFNKDNNINSTNGDPNADGEGREVHTLEVPAVTRRQESYIRKVVDTVNDLDNVLYEVTNETALWSKDWQYHVIRHVKDYERSKPKQHPVGITAFDSGGAGSMDGLFASPAAWISPQNDGVSGDYQGDPPPADGRKIIISDTDHLWGVGGEFDWVWKSFLRGHHPIYMDPLKKEKWFSIDEAGMERARKAMGHTRAFAEIIPLHAMSPRSELSSTKYCLAAPGNNYLIFQPKAGAEFSVELKPGKYRFEWFDVASGQTTKTGQLIASEPRTTFKPASAMESVIYLQASPPN